MDDLIFLHGNFMPHCTARVDKHFEGYHTLQFAEQGGVELFYDTQRWLLSAGQSWVWAAYPGPHIRFHTAPGTTSWTHRYVAFRGPRIARWIAEGLWLEEPQELSAETTDYPERFDRLLHETRQTSRWSCARAINLLEAFLLELAEERSRRALNGTRSEGQEPWLAELITRLSESSDAAASLDYGAFARENGMAISTLRRRFRDATGTPLHEWAIQARITRGRWLLGETDLPIKAVAERLGYRDVYFFTRQFRQSVGVAPAAYRRSRQG